MRLRDKLFVAFLFAGMLTLAYGIYRPRVHTVFTDREIYLAAHCFDEQGFTGTDICNQVMTGEEY